MVNVFVFEVYPPLFSTYTSLPPSAALLPTVTFTLRLVELKSDTEFTVMPLPMRGVVVLLKPVPVKVTSSTSNRAAADGETPDRVGT